MNKGWICLHRCITKHWIWQDANRLKWWIDLLLRANHEDKKVLMDGSLVECKRSELITSLSTLAKDWGVSRDVVRHFLELLESDTMITRKTTTKYTQISICNYASYQDIATSEPQVSHESTTSEPQLTHTNNNNNNDNNVNKEENNNIGGVKNSKFLPPTVDEVRAYCEERNNGVDAEAFINHYTSNGWMVGRNKMKDWKASVRTWERTSPKPTAQANLGADERVENGRRTYGSGSVTVPMDAPPRPSAKHAWKAATGQWVVY